MGLRQYFFLGLVGEWSGGGKHARLHRLLLPFYNASVFEAADSDKLGVTFISVAKVLCRICHDCSSHFRLRGCFYTGAGVMSTFGAPVNISVQFGVQGN
jgi:hypothetical protein